MQKINIKDNSGDRKYFTIIPNFILNHSTMWDREVYVQMKRITGEGGTCYASRATLAKQCGMSPRRLDKSIKYLIDHKWISFIGTREIVTRGGTQYVNEYEISDLWKMNVDYYENQKGIAHGAVPKTKGMHTVRGGGSTDEGKGIAHGATKEEQENKNLRKEEGIATTSPTPKEVSLRFFSDEEAQSSVVSELVLRGAPEDAVRREISKFINYWTESNATGKKQRWEMEKTFEVNRRLSTWFGKVNQFAGVNKQISKLAWMPTKK